VVDSKNRKSERVRVEEKENEIKREKGKLATKG
jgi:hypothetical protein